MVMCTCNRLQTGAFCRKTMLAFTFRRSRVVAIIPRTVLAISLILLPVSCSTRLSVNPQVKAKPHLAKKHYVSYDGDHFGYRQWKPSDPHTVIIGVHGISGYSGDYENLAKHLRANHKGIAVYAPETRGQGMDPKKERIGDIRNRREWFKDLYTFTGLVRKAHPGARIIWLGESMGSLIVLHAYQKTPPGQKKPDGLILASPIVDIRSKLQPWKLFTVSLAAALLPKLRVSLETLSSGERPVVTKDDIHEEQAAKNAWYIPRYTLRLLLTLGNMADSMNPIATRVHCPVLVLNGGKDIFTPKEKVDAFCKHFPKATITHHYYEDSFHLLMYDHKRDQIFQDISKWLKKTR